ncbi:AAA family ATPase [bacterium]|nr:AAA family ATPase [bacterium]
MPTKLVLSETSSPYNLRQRRVLVTTLSETDEASSIEFINCLCGYESDFPLGTACPKCGEIDEPFEEEEESEREMTYNDIEQWREELYLNEMKVNKPELYELLQPVREYLVNEIPKIDTILTTPMELKDKAEILEIYEVMMSTPTLTFEWIGIKQALNKLITKAIKSEKERAHWDVETRTQMDAEVKLLEESTNDANMEYQIRTLKLPFEEKVKIFQRFRMWEQMEPSNEEYGKIHAWITTVLEMPWGIYHTISLSQIETIVCVLKDKLDKKFYGLKSVKEQLLLYIHHRLQYPKSANSMLGLLGPPGVGKTSLVHILAESIGIPFYPISGGSLTSNDSIYGHSYTYVGAEPGEFVKACIQLKSLGGIAFIDEFEKIPTDKCLSALLQLIDPVQNHTFKDRYLDMRIDLSKIFFIGSMNELPKDKALRDRIFPIQLKGYSGVEKFNILKNITIPKLLKSIDIPLMFTDDSIRAIQSYANAEPGMRHCIQLTQDVIRKLCFIDRNVCHVSFTNKLKSWSSSTPITGTHVHAIISKDDLISSTHMSMYT